MKKGRKGEREGKRQGGQSIRDRQTKRENGEKAMDKEEEREMEIHDIYFFSCNKVNIIQRQTMKS